jgi:hypothetical protein
MGSDLPSPLFTPRPGWGGRLRQWWSENGYGTVFRSVLLIALIILAATIFTTRDNKSDVAVTPSPTPTIEAIEEAARPGEGISHLASRVLNAYIAEEPATRALEPVEHLFAVDYLSRMIMALSSRSPFTLRANENVRFPVTALNDAIAKANALTPQERTNWSRFLKK